MQNLLFQHPHLRPIAEEASKYRLQAVLGLIEPDAEGQLTLIQHPFRLGAEYFYPASSIKLFAAVAALERLAELRCETGLPITPDSPLVYHPLFAGEVLENSDPSHLGSGLGGDASRPGSITVGHEIRKLFLVSDNQAFNRLYELVGQDGLMASLERAGLRGTRIVHRLSEARSVEENLRFPKIDFLAPDAEPGSGSILFTLPEREAPPLASSPLIGGLEVGEAHMVAGRRVDAPLDFSAKNRISLADLQRGLCMVVRPDVACGGPGFQLSDDDRFLLLEAMSQLPRESRDPAYAQSEFPDHYAKFLLPGLRRVLPPQRVRVYNKIGQAYGFTTENAWVTDPTTGRGFFLAATLYTNSNGVLNDDLYDYETLAAVFFADLGEAAGRQCLLTEEERKTAEEADLSQPRR